MTSAPKRSAASARAPTAGAHSVAQLDLQRSVLLAQRSDAVVGAVELEQPLGRPGGPGEHPVDAVGGVPAHDGGELGEPLLRGRQAQRVGVDRGQVAGQLQRDVGQQVADLDEPGAQRGQRRVVRGRGLQRAPRGGDQPERVGASGSVSSPVRAVEAAAAAARRSSALASRSTSATSAWSSPAAGASASTSASPSRSSSASRARSAASDSSAARVARRVAPARPGGGDPVAQREHGLAGVAVQRVALLRRAAAAAAGRSDRAAPWRTRRSRRAPPPVRRGPRGARGTAPSAPTVRVSSSTSSSSSAPGVDRPDHRGRVGGQHAAGPRRRPCRRPGRTRPASARPPNSRLSPCTTIVLPAPVSPVTTVSPGPSRSTASSMTPSPRMRSSSSTGGA